MTEWNCHCSQFHKLWNLDLILGRTPKCGKKFQILDVCLKPNVNGEWSKFPGFEGTDVKNSNTKGNKQEDQFSWKHEKFSSKAKVGLPING